MSEIEYVYAVLMETWEEYCKQVVGVEYREGEFFIPGDFYTSRDEAHEHAKSLTSTDVVYNVLCIPRYKIAEVCIVGTPEYKALHRRLSAKARARVKKYIEKREAQRAYWREAKRRSRANASPY